MRREEEAFFLSMDGVGVHEVIVKPPVHNKLPALMQDAEVMDALLAYIEGTGSCPADNPAQAISGAQQP